MAIHPPFPRGELPFIALAAARRAGPGGGYTGPDRPRPIACPGMPRLAHVFAPRDRVYFELFAEAGQNVLQASDLLDRLLSNYTDNKELAQEILVCAQGGDR